MAPSLGILVKLVSVFQLPVDNLKLCNYLFEKFEHSGIVIDSGGHVYDVEKRTCRTNGSWKNTSPLGRSAVWQPPAKGVEE